MADELITRGLVQIQLDGKDIDQAVALLQKITEGAKESAKGVDQIGASAKAASKEVGYLEEQFTTLGRTLIAGAGVLEFTRYLKESFLEFAKLDRSFTTLRNQLDVLGQGGSFDQIKDALKAIGEESGQLDSTVIPAMNRLLLTTGNVRASQELLAVAANYARAGFGDLESNATRLALALQTGQVRSLRPFGIELKDVNGKTIDLGDAFKRLIEESEALKIKAPDAQAKVEKWKQVGEDISVALGHAADQAANLFDKLNQLENQRFAASAKTGNDATWFGRRQKQLADNMDEAAAAFGEVPASVVQREKSAQELAAEMAANARKTADEERLKKEEEVQNQITTIEEKAGEERLQSELNRTEKGSQERIALELQVNALLEEHRVREAERTFAQRKIRTKDEEQAIADIRAQFAAKASAIRASRGETEAERKARTGVVGDLKFEAGNDLETMKAIEEYSRKHEDELTRIADEGEVARLKAIRDLTLDGTQARFDAEAALQLAELQLQTDRELAAAKKQADIKALIEKNAADKKAAIEAASDKVRAEARKAAALQEAQYYVEAGAAILRMFGKNKAAALGLLTINTATAVMNAWAHAKDWEEGLAETIAIGAIAEEQRRQIMSASPNGAGGGSATTPLGAAANPTSAAAGPSAAPPPAFTGGSSGVGLEPMSREQFNGMTGRTSSAGGQSVVVNVRYAFGDKPAMIKLSREIVRTINNNPSVMR